MVAVLLGTVVKTVDGTVDVSVDEMVVVIDKVVVFDGPRKQLQALDASVAAASNSGAGVYGFWRPRFCRIGVALRSYSCQRLWSIVRRGNTYMVLVTASGVTVDVSVTVAGVVIVATPEVIYTDTRKLGLMFSSSRALQRRGRTVMTVSPTVLVVVSRTVTDDVATR